MADDSANPEKDELRRELKTAVARVVRRIAAEKRFTQIELSGAAELSRTTVRHVMDLSEREEASSSLNTLADVLYGLSVPPCEFASRLAEELSSLPAPSRGAIESGQFEVRIGNHLLAGRLVHVRDKGT